MKINSVHGMEIIHRTRQRGTTFGVHQPNPGTGLVRSLFFFFLCDVEYADMSVDMIMSPILILPAHFAGPRTQGLRVAAGSRV